MVGRIVVVLSAVAVAALMSTTASARGGAGGGARGGGVHGAAVGTGVVHAGIRARHGGGWRARRWGGFFGGVAAMSAASAAGGGYAYPVTYNGYGYDDGYATGADGGACDVTTRQIPTAYGWRLQRFRVCAGR